MKKAINDLFEEQLQHWKMAGDNYAALNQVREKSFRMEDGTIRVQFNPSRIVSSAAKVDPASIRRRACFLCAENRPPEQRGVSFLDQYTLLVNPFPIFPFHLTIPDWHHTPQRIQGRIGDMLALADALTDSVIFYNGPKCGASAPDHMHFQAGNKGFLPWEREWETYPKAVLRRTDSYALWKVQADGRFAWVLKTTDKQSAVRLFDEIYASLNNTTPEEEPMMNLLAWYTDGHWVLTIFPRKKHRPTCFSAMGEEQLTISPASVDLGGVFITPIEKDFEKINAEHIRTILEEVCLCPSDSEFV